MKLPLRAAIILAILCGLLLPATLMGYYSLSRNLEQAHSALRSDHQRFLDILVLGIREPLWNMAPDAGRPLMDSIMGDERVVRINVTDAMLGVFIFSNRPDRRQGQLTQLTRTVYKQGTMIGSVSVEMDDGLVVRKIKHDQWLLLLALFAQIAISLGLTTYLLHKRVLIPLRLLNRQASQLASNHPDTIIAWHRHDEIGELGNNLDNARKTLYQQMQKLEQRNVQLETELISQQQIEAALRADQHRTEQLLEIVNVVHWNANPNEWRFTFVSPQAQALLGYPVSEWYSEDFFSRCLDPDDRHLIYELFTNQQHDHHEFACRMRRQDGEMIWIFCSATGAQDAHGRRTLHGILMDISARKHVEKELENYRNQLEEALEQRTRQLASANHEIETFSQSLSNDLRTPLRAIEGFSQVLAEDYSSQLDTNARSYLQRIRSSIHGMASLIDDLLNLAKLSRGDIRRQDTDLSALAHDVFDELAILQIGRTINITIDPDLRTSADPKLLRIALYNLFDNAWKFTATTPLATIRFGMSLINGKEVFYVSDNGIGFDMSQVNKLFNPFQRLHTQAEFNDGGNGIGLAIVQRIVARHDGRIWAKSAPGEGATFYFTLPNN